MDEMQVLRDCKDGALDAELEVGPGDPGKSDMSKKRVNASGWNRTNVSVISHSGRRLDLPCPPGPIRCRAPSWINSVLTTGLPKQIWDSRRELGVLI
jgi:hypothetical protein